MRPQIVLFGDSITEFSADPANGSWGAALANHFSRRADVVLRGFSGYNTRWALLAAEKAMEGLGSSQEVKAVTLFFGANDAALADHCCGFQHIPVSEYRDNLRSLSAFLQKRFPSAVIVLITPPPIDEEGRILDLANEDPKMLPDRTNQSAGEYAKACISVAEELGCPVIDLWTKIQQYQGWQKSALCDGLHFAPPGSKILFEELAEVLKQKGLSPETLPLDLPLFSSIDPADPASSFKSS